jgi:anti-sigma B factor antagonist
MKITISTVDEVMVLSVKGSIDSQTAPEFQTAILAQIETDNNLILDLRENEFISSAGLRVLLIVYRSSKITSGKLVLVGASEEIREVMHNTGFSKFFTFADILEEGIKIIK